MHVLHLNEHLAPKGGVETYLLAVMPTLAERGVRSTLAYGQGDPALWPDSRQLAELGNARRERAAFADVSRCDLDWQSPTCGALSG